MAHAAGADLRVGTELAGYRVEALVGRGGMGVVYRAFDPRLKRRVALKLLAPELAADEGFRERFLRESELAASLDHPNAIPIYEAGEADGHLYIAMRLVEGPDLGILLEREGRLEPERAIAITAPRGMAKEPEERYASAAELITDAAAALGLPGQAWAPVALRRRRRWTLAVLAAALAATGALTAGLLLALDRDAPAPPPDATPVARPLTRLEPNSLGLVDPETGALAADVELPFRPGDVAVDAEDVWVTAPDTGRIIRIDQDARAVVDTIPVGFDPTAVAAGDGAVWVTQGDGPSLVRLSPDTGGVVQTIPVGSGPVDVAAGHGAVWVANRLDDTVQRVDPRTGEVARTITVGDEPTAIAVSGDAVWVACFAAGKLYRIDARSDEVTAIVPVGRGPSSLAVARSGVWVTSALDRTLARIDPVRAVVAETIEIAGGPAALASDGTTVWVASELGTALSQVGETGRTVRQVARLGTVPHALALGSGSLWVSVRGTATSHRGGTLRLVADPGSMPGTIDPRTASDFYAELILTVTNDGLVEHKRVGGVEGATLVPNLALRIPEPTDGGTTYAFRLRPGIRYSTGELVRASDFRRTIEQVLASPSDWASLYSGIRGAQACTSRRCDLSEGIVTKDAAATIEFRLSAPDPEFLYKLARVAAYPLPPTAPDPESSRRPVPATGPYMIEELAEGKRVILVRNPRFREWSREAQPDGYPDRIELRLGASRDAAITAVAQGRADLLISNSPPRERLDELETVHASQVHLVAFPATWFLSLNTRVPPFDDVRVRRALNYALDRAAIVDAFGGPRYARATCQILPPNFPSYEPYCPYTTSSGPAGQWSGPDLPAASSLVRASRTAGTKVQVWVDRYWPFAIAVGREVVATLRTLGYRASLRAVDGSERYWSRILDSRTRTQAALGGWIPLFPTAREFVASGLSCSSFVPGDPSRNGNLPAFCDPTIDAMMKRASTLQATDPARARGLWTRIDQAIVDQAPYAPLVSDTWFELTSERVGNYQFHLLWGPLLEQLWVR